METIVDPSKYCEMYLVRHGRVTANDDRLMAGHTDTPLTVEGKAYLSEVAEMLKEIRFDAIFASDLGRAISTAEIIKGERKLEIQTREMLRERFYDTLEGKHHSEYLRLLKEIYPDLEEIDSEKKFTVRLSLGGETAEEAGQRYILALREIAVGYIGKRVMVVGHGTALRSFLIKVTGMHPNELPSGSFKNGGYVRIYSDGVDFFVKEMNIS